MLQVLIDRSEVVFARRPKTDHLCPVHEVLGARPGRVVAGIDRGSCLEIRKNFLLTVLNWELSGPEMRNMRFEQSSLPTAVPHKSNEANCVSQLFGRNSAEPITASQSCIEG